MGLNTDAGLRSAVPQTVAEAEPESEPSAGMTQVMRFIPTGGGQSLGLTPSFWDEGGSGQFQGECYSPEEDWTGGPGRGG